MCFVFLERKWNVLVINFWILLVFISYRLKYFGVIVVVYKERYIFWNYKYLMKFNMWLMLYVFVKKYLVIVWFLGKLKFCG